MRQPGPEASHCYCRRAGRYLTTQLLNFINYMDVG